MDTTKSLILGVQLPASYWREQLEQLSARMDAPMPPEATGTELYLERCRQAGRALALLDGVVGELERAEQRVEHQAAAERAAAGRCECENSRCPCEASCTAELPPAAAVTIYGTKLCASCTQHMPGRYLTRPTPDTDPGECRWCREEAMGQGPAQGCPYHGEQAQRDAASGQ